MDNYTVTITMPKSICKQIQTENHMMQKIYREHYVSHVSINQDHEPYNIVQMQYSAKNIGTFLILCRWIYDHASGKHVTVNFQHQKYDIHNSDFHKLLLSDIAHDFSTQKVYPILSEVIQTKSLKTLEDVKQLADIPFSGFMHFDHLDYYDISGDIGYYFDSLPLPDTIDESASEMHVANRYLSQDLHIKKRPSVHFENCIIDGNIEISCVDSVTFWNCIILGKITCTGAKQLKITECNAFYFLVYNCDFITLKIALSKIHRLEMHTCRIDNFNIYDNKFVQPYLANLAILDKKMDADQFNVNKISPKYIRKVKGFPVDSFFLTYQLDAIAKQRVTPDDITIDTIDVLLQHGIFKNDYDQHGKLKYKRMLYSNHGLKKLFVFITGGFYLPYRWIVYLICIACIFPLFYTNITDGFKSTLDMSYITLDYPTALQYSILQIIGANTLAIESIGLCQILSIIQSALNTTIIANFFASIIKKYMDTQ